MKILIDINHPAHVHYFKNFIREMEGRGHEFRIVNRDSKIINQLLDAYGIKHVIRNKRPEKKGSIASIKYLAGIVAYLIKESISFRPDLYLGFASSACAITASIFRSPSILIDDTEHNTMNHRIYKPLCSSVLTPFFFEKNLGPNQIRFQAFVEQLYLHSKYFKRDTGVAKRLGLKPNNYAIVRYIAYDAHHDLKAVALTEDDRKKLVDFASEKSRVIISHEKDSCDSFYNDFKIEFAPEEMHEIEANAKFIVSEGATMASECFVTGVPFAYINPLKVGYINYASKDFPEVAFSGTDLKEIEKAIEGFNDKYFDSNLLRSNLEKMTINPTDFLIWFVEDFPKSAETMKQNPEYQLKFATTPPELKSLESIICALRSLTVNNARDEDSDLHRASCPVSFL